MDKIKDHFSKTVGDYDTVADKVVFKNDEIHAELVRAIPYDKDAEFSVLDIGCGTGHGIELIAESYPNAHITGIDFSFRMIQKAGQNLAKYSNITLLFADVNKFHFKQSDVIVSAFAIHNSNHDQQRALFKKIYDSSEVFINADFYEHECAHMDNDLCRIYRSYLEENLSGEELEVWLRHAFDEDMPMTLTEQSSILKNAGFSSFELKWLFNNQAVYVAKK